MLFHNNAYYRDLKNAFEEYIEKLEKSSEYQNTIIKIIGKKDSEDIPMK